MARKSKNELAPMWSHPIDPFILDCAFHKVDRAEGPVYWRECVQRDGMRPDEVGYMVVWPDGSNLHTYHYPPNFLC